MKKKQNKKPAKKLGSFHSDGPVLTTQLRKEFLQFLEYHPAKRFSLNLRKMLMDFLMCDGTIESSYLNDLLYDMEGLFDLLDVAQSESQDRNDLGTA